ncbi:MAG: hypothetical protein IJ131_08530 [Eggerthellaceae bacterium]|nr:hypothetical protein [Eggerthellaceae bacterium]
MSNGNEQEILAIEGEPSRSDMHSNSVQAEGSVGAELTSWLDGNKTVKIVSVAVLLVLALVSAFPAGSYFSSPDAYKGTIASLDEKQGVVTGLMAVSVATSTAITALPNDIGSPIAERLANLSGDFLIILTAIYLEKFLLTTFGFAAFRILIPLACILAIIAVVLVGKAGIRSALGRVAVKMLLLAVTVAIVVPLSIFISDKMEETHNVSVSNMLEEFSGEENVVEGLVAEGQDGATASSQDDTASSQDSASQKNDAGSFFDRIVSGASDFISETTGGIAKSFDDIKQKALNLLNRLTDSLALLIVTSCIIPILVLLLFLWIVKLILGVDVDAATRFIKPRAFGGTRRMR